MIKTLYHAAIIIYTQNIFIETGILIGNISGNSVI